LHNFNTFYNIPLCKERYMEDEELIARLQKRHLMPSKNGLSAVMDATSRGLICEAHNSARSGKTGEKYEGDALFVPLALLDEFTGTDHTPEAIRISVLHGHWNEKLAEVILRNRMYWITRQDSVRNGPEVRDKLYQAKHQNSSRHSPQVEAPEKNIAGREKIVGGLINKRNVMNVLGIKHLPDPIPMPASFRSVGSPETIEDLASLRGRFRKLVYFLRNMPEGTCLTTGKGGEFTITVNGRTYSSVDLRL
jgi:hypothetical protein